jgi:hypothetical protein
VIEIGGKIRNGFSIVSGIIRNDVKKFIDLKVNKGEFLSRSKAIGTILTEYVNNKKNSDSKDSQLNASKHNDIAYKLQSFDIDTDMIFHEDDTSL